MTLPRIQTYPDPFHHVVGIHLDASHVELHRADVLADADKLAVQLVRFPELLGASILLLRRLAFLPVRFERLKLLRQEGLCVLRLNLQSGRVTLAAGECQGVLAGILDRDFVKCDHRSWDGFFFSVGISVGFRPTLDPVAPWQREWLGQVNRPSVADGLNVESFPQHPNLSPRVPVGRNSDLVPVNDIVLQGLPFEQ